MKNLRGARKEQEIMNKLQRAVRSRWFWIISLIVLSVISITIGVEEFNLMGFIQGNTDDVFLAFISRIPRVTSIIITGASLSISGLIMQTMTQNKFVSPSTAGTMEWCRLGIMISMLLFNSQSTMNKMMIAFITSLIGTLLFMEILKRIQFKNAMVVPLMGMMLGSTVSAVTSFFAYKYDVIQNMSSWMQGNFSLVIKGRYELIYIGIPFLVFAYIYANKFTIAGMGESFSTSLGLNYKMIVTLGLIIVAVISSVVVVTVGSVPFVGLIVPNLIAMIKGDNIKNTLLDTAILGALFLLACDLIGRVIIFPYEVSISIVVSILGSILFLILIMRRKSENA